MVCNLAEFYVVDISAAFQFLRGFLSWDEKSREQLCLATGYVAISELEKVFKSIRVSL